MGNRIKLSEEEIRLGFVASCVEFVATKLNKPYNEIFIRMKNVDMFRNYIYPCYDVLKTESWDNLTEDLIKFLNNEEKSR